LRTLKIDLKASEIVHVIQGYIWDRFQPGWPDELLKKTDRRWCSRDKVGKWWWWGLGITVVLLPACSKSLWGTVSLIPVEEKIAQNVVQAIFVKINT
jgi:hypothetical protein